jgi:hypothetical protein
VGYSWSIDVNTYIPPRAFPLLDLVKSESNRLMPNMPYPYYFGALIEHESCISLTHSRCWSPTSQLKSQREIGIGLSQLSKAYNPDGSVRFDVLSDLAKRHKQELKELSWNTVRDRPDLQIRAMILLSRGNYNALYTIQDPYERLAMTDVAYNGGLGGLQKERRVCGLSANCDPNKWFDNVERYCLKSKKPIYAGRSACTISRNHPVDTLKHRMPKYKKQMQ